MKRQIWWNFRGLAEEELVRYFFVILNDNREINEIESKIYETFAPIVDLETKDGKCDFHFYKLLIFNSQKRFDAEQKPKIYSGEWINKRRLYDRADWNIEKLEDYIISELRQKV